MSKLSDKYIAGFFDADGSISVVFIADCVTPQLRIAFSQKTSQDEVLHLIHEEYGGSLTYDVIKDTSYTKLSYSGNRQCMVLMNRVRKHLVVKRTFVDVCLDVCSRKLDRSEHEKVRAYLKIQRKQKSLPLPNFPSRKWMAGYLDGDGCISVTGLRKPFGQASTVLHIAAEAAKSEGIELIHKAFGGAIHPMCDGRVRQLAIPLNDPSKVKEIFGYCGADMVVKRDQAEFILRCAEMGHFRDGKSIKDGLKYLKAQPHRLSEPKPDGVALLATVKDLPPFVRSRESYLPRAKR